MVQVCNNIISEGVWYSSEMTNWNRVSALGVLKLSNVKVAREERWRERTLNWLSRSKLVKYNSRPSATGGICQGARNNLRSRRPYECQSMSSNFQPQCALDICRLYECAWQEATMMRPLVYCVIWYGGAHATKFWCLKLTLTYSSANCSMFR
jgi:hypothetical protein